MPKIDQKTFNPKITLKSKAKRGPQLRAWPNRRRVFWGAILHKYHVRSAKTAGRHLVETTLSPCSMCFRPITPFQNKSYWSYYNNLLFFLALGFFIIMYNFLEVFFRPLICISFFIFLELFVFKIGVFFFLILKKKLKKKLEYQCFGHFCSPLPPF
jgi:hypothetical protein